MTAPPEVWEPHVPVVGGLYRARISPECRSINTNGKRHGETNPVIQGMVVRVIDVLEDTPKREGHRFVVAHLDQRDSRIYRAAAIELEPLDEGEAAS